MNNILSQIKKQIIQDGHLTLEFLESGDLFRIFYQHNQINLLRGNLIDGSVSNLYLRKKQHGNIVYQKLLGIHSNSKFAIMDNRAIYQGDAFGLCYQVILSVKNQTWHYDLLLKGNVADATFDVIYGQDIAIASFGSVLSSEAYTAQYIDHRVFETKSGYCVLSRQNQGDPQILQLGTTHETISYLTDGFQFFTKNYKLTNEATILSQESLPNYNYQYEFPYISLQSKELDFSAGHEEILSFYGYYEPYHAELASGPLSVSYPIEDTWLELNSFQPKLTSAIGKTVVGRALSTEEIHHRYPNKRHLEMKDGTILSFFTDNHSHIVLQEKELLVERPHGHILIHGDLLHVSERVMASTNFMYGVFSSHTVLGNTNFNKLTGDVRNFLNVQKISGQRIYLKKGQTYHLLTLPSLYEIGINYNKWIYVLEDDTLEITVFAAFDESQERLIFQSLNNKAYDIVVTQQVLMNGMEYEVDVPYTVQDKTITLYSSNSTMIQQNYPKLGYQYHSNCPFELTSETIFLNQEHNDHGMLNLVYREVTTFVLDTVAKISDDFSMNPSLTFAVELQKFVQLIEGIAKIDFYHENQNQELLKLSDIAFWYTHNALVHYSSPHGLEQYNGAAWGTRDVCQGPVELFMSAQRFDLVREILLRTFSRQFIETGDFPQWFMFDHYFYIQAHESHGDIIVWPIRALAYYLQATGDTGILRENVPFMSMKTNNFVFPESTLLDHVHKTLETIQASFIAGTNLPAYGGGDWDDTLQPANHELTSKMVSGWTVALLYETLHVLGRELEHHFPAEASQMNELASKIHIDYEKYLVKDGVPAGFIIIHSLENIQYLLHPSDDKTGLNYRLLSFNRGMISELIDKNKLEAYQAIILKHLKHPDGVRLMNTAVQYRGGIKTYFSRAETATNFGREIGIQYVHAHIRYIEAMAKIGNAKEAYEALFTINPIQIKEAVPNADYRQSNAYFSSSDAAFIDRYQAKTEFERVRTGDISVKGGWRVYSSGPGIYINQLITNLFGIRTYHKHLWLDPMIPNELDGLEVSYHYFNKPMKIAYHIGCESKVIVNGEEFYQEALPNQYRFSGFVIPQTVLESLETINIVVYMKKNKE